MWRALRTLGCEGMRAPDHERRGGACEAGAYWGPPSSASALLPGGRKLPLPPTVPTPGCGIGTAGSLFPFIPRPVIQIVT